MKIHTCLQVGFHLHSLLRNQYTPPRLSHQSCFWKRWVGPTVNCICLDHLFNMWLQGFEILAGYAWMTAHFWLAELLHCSQPSLLYCEVWLLGTLTSQLDVIQLTCHFMLYFLWKSGVWGYIWFLWNPTFHTQMNPHHGYIFSAELPYH